MKIKKLNLKYKFAFVSIVFSLLSGCMQYRYMESSSPQVAQQQIARPCEASKGVLGVNAGRVLTEPAARYIFEKLMTESGCYSAVRFRQNISQVGHHVVLEQTLPPRPKNYPADVISFIPFFLTATIFPVRMTIDLNYSVSHYVDGDYKDYSSWENQHREYLSIVKTPVPGAGTLADFESRNAEDIAKKVLGLIDKK